MVVSDLEIAVVDKPLVVLGHTTAHTIETHGDDRITLRPLHRAVLAVVSDLPDAGRRLNHGLIAVGVVGRREIIDGGILVQLARRVDGIGAALGRGLAVADVIEVVAVAVIRVDRGSCAGELAAGVVAVQIRIYRIIHGAAIHSIFISTSKAHHSTMASPKSSRFHYREDS